MPIVRRGAVMGYREEDRRRDKESADEEVMLRIALALESIAVNLATYVNDRTAKMTVVPDCEMAKFEQNIMKDIPYARHT